MQGTMPARPAFSNGNSHAVLYNPQKNFRQTFSCGLHIIYVIINSVNIFLKIAGTTVQLYGIFPFQRWVKPAASLFFYRRVTHK